MLRYTLAFFLPALCLAIPAMAQTNQQGPRLTEKIIDEFYEFSETANQMDRKSYLEWSDQVTAPGFMNISETTVTMEGFPPAVHSETMDKIKFMENVAAAYESTHPATLTNYVVSMDIAADGRSAHIVNQTTIKGIVMGAATGDAKGTCEDDLAMSRQGKLQIVRSNCKLQMRVIPPKSTR